MKTILECLLTVVFSMLSTGVYAATDFYHVTQSGSGAKDGKSLAGAWSVSDFNSPANWSTGDNADKIDPGDTVSFSGIITSKIDIMGSGSSGKYITFDGKTAQINIDVNQIGIGGAIHAVNKNYLKFQNFTIDGQMTTGENRGGICIKSSSGNSNHIIIDNCNITKTSAGIWLWGNVGNVGITNCYLHNLSGSGLWSVGLSGEADTPHYVTFGGSAGNGNTVKNAGYLDYFYNVDSDVYVDQGDDIIISYNHLYSDSPDHGFSGMYLNECRNVLVEYNRIHGHDVDHHRSPITFKDDQIARKTGYAIVRFNHVFNSRSNVRSWGDASSGIGIGYNTEHFYVYGNYIKDCGVGIRPNIGWASPYYKDGINSDHLYIFSNIINTTQQAGIRVEGPPGSSYDTMSDVYIFNNTIYKPATFDFDQDYIDSGDTAVYSDDSGIYSKLADEQTINFHIKNNVIMNSRPDKSDYTGIFFPEQSDLFMDYNHHYHPAGTPQVHIKGSNCIPCTWNSSDIPRGYGEHDTEGSTGLTAPSNGDFRISSSSSPLVNSGFDMGSGIINTIIIQGTPYSVRWDTALDPHATDWTTIPPTVVTAGQDDHGTGWEKGAYLWKKGSQITPPTGFRIEP